MEIGAETEERSEIAALRPRSRGVVYSLTGGGLIGVMQHSGLVGSPTRPNTCQLGGNEEPSDGYRDKCEYRERLSTSAARSGDWGSSRAKRRGPDSRGHKKQHHRCEGHGTADTGVTFLQNRGNEPREATRKDECQEKPTGGPAGAQKCDESERRPGEDPDEGRRGAMRQAQRTHRSGRHESRRRETHRSGSRDGESWSDGPLAGAVCDESEDPLCAAQRLGAHLRGPAAAGTARGRPYAARRRRATMRRRWAASGAAACWAAARSRLGA